jgi:predicted ATPase/DNA-binding CsgD family transcriptional regulator
LRTARSDRGLHNVPAEVTSFIGRRRELAEIKQLLATTRLLTLTGPGGVGKTRLALRTAADIERAFPDGVWLVELAPLQDPALVAQAVFNALEFRDQSARWMMATITDYLADKNLLLIMDNCEHLLSACAVLVDNLLRACPNVHVLATSRQPLGMSGEVTLTVPSLSMPDQGPVAAGSRLTDYEAIALFAERAVAALPGFQLVAPNRDEVIQLCRRLDGIPLAIELAAVRLKALSVEQIVERLDDRFRLLTAGNRTAMPRHQTLQATIEWSYGLLSEPEQKLWTRLSIFAGGFDIAAAEQVCAGDGIDEVEVFDLIAGLLDKSILVREEVGAKVRYRLLETLRDFGLLRLRDSGKERTFRRRHRAWLQKLVGVEGEWLGVNQSWIFDRLQIEHDNLRAALDFCLNEPGEAEAGLAIAAYLWPYWQGRGHLSEGRRWLDALLERVPDNAAVRARGLAAAGNLAMMQGDLGAAMSILEESHARAERDGNAAVRAFSLQYLGLGSMFQGDRARAVSLFEEALRIDRATGDRAAVSATENMLAMTLLLENDPSKAVALWHESRAISLELGDQWVLSYTLWGLGIALWLQGESIQATVVEKESLRLKRALDERLGIALCLETLAWLAMSRADAQRAARLLGAAKANWDATGASLFVAFITYHDTCEAESRKALRGAFDVAFQKGADMPIDLAVAYALEEKTESPEAKVEGATTSTLSRREREIAHLVAQGLTNKEIAAKLVLSERTAEAHIQNILNKLGFRSRSEVAAWVAASEASRQGAPSSG